MKHLSDSCLVVDALGAAARKGMIDIHYLHIYIYIYIYVYIHMHIYLYISSAYIYIHIYVHTYIYIYIHIIHIELLEEFVQLQLEPYERLFGPDRPHFSLDQVRIKYIYCILDMSVSMFYIHIYINIYIYKYIYVYTHIYIYEHIYI
jgi:hypothetical protein